ncbi:thiol methyltransferase [Colletotrichum truncatum]|uniref:Thiol methyltransferase n=1 Tax=Colletotrichum truncatum TaxID=5467 RepID=A0ACC3ZDU9_COLTU|nr:thiol methyltransferase [Colletotrichum truncatum]KAF6794822.1 thiol methyltransferase [Colletotrichum truncatum]
MSSKLSDTFSGSPLSTHGSKWSALWEEKYTPWDRGSPSLALFDVLTTRPDLVPPPPPPPTPSQGNISRPTALVPGCGKGHDVLLLADLGYDVLGLDFSPTAIEQAKENQKTEGSGVGSVRRPDGPEPGTVTWLSGDFFSDSWLDEWGRGRTFDLIFDYTFLCALPPSARPLWATRMTSLLAPKGRLICLEFPSGKPLSAPGPPWGLTPEIYLALLAHPGAPLEFSSSTEQGDDKDVVMVPPFREDGLKRLELIKPDRTHPAGMNPDGTVCDWIHVWSR